MSDGTGTSMFSTDRLNSQQSAISLNNGYLKLPAGVYFKGDFTISFWVKITASYPGNTRLLDCGRGSALDNVGIAFQQSPLKPKMFVFNNALSGGTYYSIWGTFTLAVGPW
jgi:hypothetical protein